MDNEKVSSKLLLVFGCGLGIEALCLKIQMPDLIVVGLDINPYSFIDDVKKKIPLISCDGRNLPFRENIFNYTYCYHVIEHIVPYQKCIEEIKRILKSNGGLFLSTPNRRRLIGYICIGTSLKQLLKRNFREFSARLRGNFIPEKYHTGFYEEELLISLKKYFLRVRCLTNKYDIYISRKTFFEVFVKIFHRLGILRLFTVSHTFYCKTND